MKTPEEHAELESEYAKFKELQGWSERLLEAQKMMERCREDKDEALKVMLQVHKKTQVESANLLIPFRGSSRCVEVLKSSLLSC